MPMIVGTNPDQLGEAVNTPDMDRWKKEQTWCCIVLSSSFPGSC